MIGSISRSTAKPVATREQRPAIQPSGRRLFERLFRRRAEPTTFQRCLAIHIHFAEPQRNTFH
jgi:hypothetical protein